MTALRSFENGAKLFKRNDFQFETKTSSSIKFLGPIKVKCQSEDSFIDFVHNVNLQNDPLIQGESGVGHKMLQGLFL